jgi:hypothetical protein
MKKLMWKREGFLDSLTFLAYTQAGIFTTKLHSENRTFGYHKCVCGARNPCLLIGDVIASVFFLFHLFVDSSGCEAVE